MPAIMSIPSFRLGRDNILFIISAKTTQQNRYLPSHVHLKYQSLKGVDTVEPNKKAFTLIELIIVIFIIGMASAVVGGSLYRNMDDIRLKTAAKEMAATRRYARSRSVAEKKVYSFIADVKGYGLYTDHSDIGLKTGHEKHAYSLYKYYPAGIDIENREREEAGIDFFPEGDSTGGSIILKNRKASSYVISVDKIQSSVKIK